jgi:hypothetical protein
MTQAPLFEPTGPEVHRLAFDHVTRAERMAKLADVARARGWMAVEAAHRKLAAEHQREAEELAMLADFERLAGLA